MTAQVITLPHRPRFSPVIDLDHRAQVVRFPSLRTREELAEIDEDCAAIAINRAFDRLEDELGRTMK